MSRETDWHVFDKACEITAMAARGTASGVKADQIADIFRQVHAVLRETADAMEGGRPAGF
jgi:hypothetical protein